MVSEETLNIRRRVSAWNRGEDTTLADVFYDESLRRWIVTSWASAMDVFLLRNSGRTWSRGAHQCPVVAGNVNQLIAQAESLFSMGLTYQKSPDSERLRKTVMRFLGAKQMQILAPELEKMASQLVAAGMARGSLEIITELAEPLLQESLYGKLGIARELWPALSHRLSPAAFMLFAMNITEAERTAGFFALARISQIARELLVDSGAEKAPIISYWIDAIRQGIWSTDEAIAQITMVILAGSKTPVTAIASMVHQLCQRPDVWTAARNGTLPLENIINETLRLGAPNAVVPKESPVAITLGSVDIAAGQPLLVLVGCANRDPAMFVNPMKFDPWRAEKNNLAFGYGTRRCPGMYLSRLLMHTVLRVLLKKIPELALRSQPCWKEILHCEQAIARLEIETSQVYA